MKALILSGGKGLRLRPLTDDRPKSMVALDGRPMAEWQLDWLKSSSDLDEVVFLCGYKWERLKAHFGTEFKGVKVEYSVERSPLGTGGAIKKGLAHLGGYEGNVVVANGDIITSLPLKKMIHLHENSLVRPAITMMLTPYKSRFGAVRIGAGNVVERFEEKPVFPNVWINGGIYVINAGKVEAHLPAKGDIERETFPILAREKAILSFPYRGPWNLVDSIKDLQEVEERLKTPSDA